MSLGGLVVNEETGQVQRADGTSIAGPVRRGPHRRRHLLRAVCERAVDRRLRLFRPARRPARGTTETTEVVTTGTGSNDFSRFRPSFTGGSTMKQTVVLFGASGTMGCAAFKELWKRRADYDIVHPGASVGEEQEALPSLRDPSAAQRRRSRRLKIVWGDATRYEDVEQAVRGADWVLDAMAFISPEADYHPEKARAVNTDAIRNIVRAIEAQPGGAERIRLIYTGTVAETGDRLGCIHMGRVGDPLKPSIFDYYATSKIAGERAVLESNIRHWASLRMTYIMPTTYTEFAALSDPIMFHLPLDSCMENITDRDAGFGMVNCLDIPDDSDFWRRAYNMGGGPAHARHRLRAESTWSFGSTACRASRPAPSGAGTRCATFTCSTTRTATSSTTTCTTGAIRWTTSTRRCGTRCRSA